MTSKRKIDSTSFDDSLDASKRSRLQGISGSSHASPANAAHCERSTPACPDGKKITRRLAQPSMTTPGRHGRVGEEDAERYRRVTAIIDAYAESRRHVQALNDQWRNYPKSVNVVEKLKEMEKSEAELLGENLELREKLRQSEEEKRLSNFAMNSLSTQLKSEMTTMATKIAAMESDANEKDEEIQSLLSEKKLTDERHREKIQSLSEANMRAAAIRANSPAVLNANKKKMIERILRGAKERHAIQEDKIAVLEKDNMKRAEKATSAEQEMRDKDEEIRQLKAATEDLREKVKEQHAILSTANAAEIVVAAGKKDSAAHGNETSPAAASEEEAVDDDNNSVIDADAHEMPKPVPSPPVLFGNRPLSHGGFGCWSDPDLSTAETVLQPTITASPELAAAGTSVLPMTSDQQSESEYDSDDAQIFVNPGGSAAALASKVHDIEEMRQQLAMKTAKLAQRRSSGANIQYAPEEDEREPEDMDVAPEVFASRDTYMDDTSLDEAEEEDEEDEEMEEQEQEQDSRPEMDFNAYVQAERTKKKELDNALDQIIGNAPRGPRSTRSTHAGPVGGSRVAKSTRQSAKRAPHQQRAQTYLQSPRSPPQDPRRHAHNAAQQSYPRPQDRGPNIGNPFKRDSSEAVRSDVHPSYPPRPRPQSSNLILNRMFVEDSSDEQISRTADPRLQGGRAPASPAASRHPAQVRRPQQSASSSQRGRHSGPRGQGRGARHSHSIWSRPVAMGGSYDDERARNAAMRQQRDTQASRGRGKIRK